MKSLYKIWGLIVLISAFAALSGCRDESQPQISQFYDFDGRGMIPDLEYVFSPFDSIGIVEKSRYMGINSYSDSSYSKPPTGDYEVAISFRYNHKCDLKSLPLSFEWGSLGEDSIRHGDIFIDFPSPAEGRAKGNFGLYETNKTIIKKCRGEEGLYIAVSTPEKQTRGLVSMGVVCRKL